MKEYLDENYVLQTLNSELKKPEGWIKVPDGAELCTLLKEYLIFWKGTKNKRPHYDDWLECNHTVDDYLNEYKDAKIVWQRPQQPESLPFVDDEKPYNHYFKDVSNLEFIDVYRVLDLFAVEHPCIQHAVKKLLCAGQRGSKNRDKDIQEAIDSLIRFQDMRMEDNK